MMDVFEVHGSHLRGIEIVEDEADNDFGQAPTQPWGHQECWGAW